MPDVRALMAATVRQQIAQARGLARGEFNRAEAALTKALEYRDQVARERVDAHARYDRSYHEDLATAAVRHSGELRALAEDAWVAAQQAASGAAGTPWEAWQSTPIGSDHEAPLLRIGEVRPDLAVPETPDDPAEATAGSAAGAGGSPRADRLVAVPALVPLLDHGHVALSGDDRTGIDRVLTVLLTRVLGTAAPGGVQLTAYDPEHLGGSLAAFAPLNRARLLSFTGPGGLGALLDHLVEQIHRIRQTVLAGQDTSLRDRALHGGGRPEPWRLAVLLGDGSELTGREHAALRRVLRTGPACGVHLILSRLPVEGAPGVTTVRIDGERATVSEYPNIAVNLDEAPAAATMTDLARRIAERVTLGPPAVSLDRLLPHGKLWTHDATDAVRAPVGEDEDNDLVDVVLGDHPPHALVGGPTGSGKTNFLYAWLASLTTRYSPDELELYLLDLKEGVSFARFAPSLRDPSWLPHVRLVGLNINTDREFGLALLKFLGAELRRRAEKSRELGVTKLAELREEDPKGRWPRIIAVVDEFQALLSGRDALTNQAVDLLEDLARRGRSQGIHLVMASQDVSGIEALWGRSALVAQFTLRIALPKARRILVETNPAADQIPRHHAVINADSGVTSGNQVVRLPEAGDRAKWTRLLDRMAEQLAQDGTQVQPPRVFDGDAVPLLDEAPDFLTLRAQGPWQTPRPATTGGVVTSSIVDDNPPLALLGEAMDVQARSVRLPLGRNPGRNLAVLGTSADAARAVLGAAARSLTRQYRPGAAKFSVASLDVHPDTLAPSLREALPRDTRWYGRDTVVELLSTAAGSLAGANPGVPHFILLYAVDAAAAQLAVKERGGSGHENLRKLMNLGPERHTHVLGWWRAVPRLRDDLGGPGARFDAVGAYVALDVHGAELAPLSPGGAPPWYPRPWRALFFDRSMHRSGEVMIPYREAR